jgi:hypothetical protein
MSVRSTHLVMSAVTEVSIHHSFLHISSVQNLLVLLFQLPILYFRLVNNMFMQLGQIVVNGGRAVGGYDSFTSQ